MLPSNKQKHGYWLLEFPSSELNILTQIRHNWLQNAVLNIVGKAWNNADRDIKSEHINKSLSRIKQLEKVLAMSENMFSPIRIMDTYGLFQTHSEKDKQMRQVMQELYKQRINLLPEIGQCINALNNSLKALKTLQNSPEEKSLFKEWQTSCQQLLFQLNSLPKGIWIP